MRLIMVAAALAAMCGAASAMPAKALFGARQAPSAGTPAPIGGYAAGCLAGGRALAADGPGWQVMRPSRNRAWGDPAAAAFVERLASRARAIGWPGLLVGDISQPRGGPMASGHRSHQIGLDIDIWLRPAPARTLSRVERESMAAESLVAPDGVDLTAAWSAAHASVLEAAARDPAVERIFVNAAIKARMCGLAPAGDRDWLARLRPWWGHDAHFHVRLACPTGAATCVPQDPVPPGDGCDASLAWWFSDEALHPAPSTAPPKPDLTLADLPAACAAVLEAR